jgi:hypothetical protein
MDRVKREDVDQGTRMRSLRYPPGQKTRGTLTKEVAHEEESPFIQPLEQFYIRCWEPTNLHNVENCSMIQGIEGIFDI